MKTRNRIATVLLTVGLVGGSPAPGVVVTEDFTDNRASSFLRVLRRR